MKQRRKQIFRILLITSKTREISIYNTKPAKELPSRAFSFRACVRASLLLSFAARRDCRRVPLNRSTPRRPFRRAARRFNQDGAHASTLAPSALCLVAKRALFPRPSRQAVAVPYGQALPIGTAVLGQTLAIGSAAVALSPFFLCPAGLLFALVGLSVLFRLFVPSRCSCTSVRLLEGE